MPFPFLLDFFFQYVLRLLQPKRKNKKKEEDYKGKQKTRDGKPKAPSLVKSHNFLKTDSSYP